MFWKLLVVMVSVVVIGAALLGLRAQRQHLHHQITLLHIEIDRARQRTWDAQVRIAQHAAPDTLGSAMERAGLELEPAAPIAPAQALPRDQQFVDATRRASPHRHWSASAR